MEDDQEQRPESLLPYDDWTEDALRHVVTRALAHVAAEGLPGQHHFYITFRTDYPGVELPDRLRSQYPQEMTIVLQHQFWDLKVDQAARKVSVGLSFGGIPASLVIPLAAVTAFADPAIRFGLRFRPASPEAAGASQPQAPAETPAALPAPPAEEPPQVVSLDAFRRRPPPTKE
jgi:uncharacterized protein